MQLGRRNEIGRRMESSRGLLIDVTNTTRSRAASWTRIALNSNMIMSSVYDNIDFTRGSRRGVLQRRNFVDPSMESDYHSHHSKCFRELPCHTRLHTLHKTTNSPFPSPSLFPFTTCTSLISILSISIATSLRGFTTMNGPPTHSFGIWMVRSTQKRCPLGKSDLIERRIALPLTSISISSHSLSCSRFSIALRRERRTKSVGSTSLLVREESGKQMQRNRNRQESSVYTYAFPTNWR